LVSVINVWIDSLIQTKTFTQLYQKYYVKPRHGYLHSDHSTLKKGRISPYDEIIKKHAERLNWDWRLLAALIYQESHFLTNQVSWAGAIGLMQLMPDVAEKYGITLESPANEQILAGVKYLQLIDKLLPAEIPKSERTAFVLASYNVGVGHVLDARRLAVKNGKNPNIWLESVEVELLKKSDRSILRDTIIRNGYARGEETYDFVRDILMRWHHYQNIVK
jgi:membrane-bound lytic murein transglycosylase F